MDHMVRGIGYHPAGPSSLIGGALWGWGIARVFDRPTRPAARTGALAFGGMVLLTAAPAELTQLWLDDLPT